MNTAKNIVLAFLPYLIAGGTAAAVLAEKSPNPIVVLMGTFAAAAIAHFNLHQDPPGGKKDPS
jgi:hypothetical protein